MNRSLCMNGYGSIIQNSQNAETSHVSAKWQEEKWDVERSVSLQQGNEGMTNYNGKESWKHYAKWKKQNMKGYTLHASITWRVQNRQITETDKRFVAFLDWKMVVIANVTHGLFGEDRMWSWLNNSGNILKTHSLHFKWMGCIDR